VRPIAALLLAALALGAAGPRDDEAQIRAALAAWAADFNAGRADRVCDIFAPDLRFDARTQPERGYQEMCGQLRRVLGDRTRHFTYALQVKEVLVSGDLAVARLVWRLTEQRTGEPATTTEEVGLDVFRRQPEGDWKIGRFITYEEGR
jgi:steroid delta-isomerase